MDEGKKIKMHFTSDKEKEAKEKKEKGQEHLASQDVQKKEETREALPSETSEETKNEDLASLLKVKEEELQKEHDRLLRALAEHERNATNAHAITEGIELVKKEFLRKLEKYGLSAISARGEKFDPNRHEAAVQIETAEHPEDTVIDEFQKGYFIHDRLLRPARVSVAKAPQSPKDYYQVAF